LTANGGISATTLSTSGAATLASASVTGNLSVGGTLTLTGGLTLNGNVTVGDASTDTLTINSTITSNLIFTDNTYDIGASGATRPRHLYLAGNGVIGGTLGVSGVLTASGGVTGNLTGNVTGNVTGNISGGTVAGTTGAFSSNVTVGGTLGVTGAATLSNTLAVTGAITATGGVLGNVTGDLTGNVTGNISGGTVAGSTGAFSSNVTVGGTLGVTGVATLTVNPVLSAGTANGVLYLNGSKVATSGSAFVFDGTNVGIGTSSPQTTLHLSNNTTAPILRLANEDTSIAAGGNLGVIEFYSGDSSGGGNAVKASIAAQQNATSPVSGDLVFNTAHSTGSLTEYMRITSLGNVGIGTSSAAYKLDVRGSTDTSYLNITSTADANNTTLRIGTDATAAFINATGGSSGTLQLRTYGTTRATIDSSGNLGLGVTPSAWGSIFKAIQVGTGGSVFGRSSGNEDVCQVGANVFWDGSNWKYIANGASTRYEQATGAHYWSIAASGTAGGTISFTEAMTLSSAGNLSVVGDINISDGQAYRSNNELILSRTNSTGELRLGSGAVGDYIVLYAGATERARISSGGTFFVNKTSKSFTTAGWSLEPNGDSHAVAAATVVLAINRQDNDGTLVEFAQAATVEGTISVSGSTVSYNGGHLSRWSQTTDNTRIALVKGTVMSNLDQMAVWIDPETGEPQENEQLNCMKVSDVEGDVNVAGVFVNWDNDDDVFANDMNIAMTGDMIIRIAQGVTVQRGDLLMSAGDGTAKPQGEDIIRSKTIAKVTSNHVTCTYDDGSYCVPCVLMAC
jgi:trimeric autotransporter adhesin